MFHWMKFGLVLPLSGLFLLLNSCRMDRSHYMSTEQRQRLETTYDTMQGTYVDLMKRYEVSADSMPPELQTLYAQMQRMHQEMETSHRQMLAMNMGRHMQGNNMMAEGMGMHMQGHMTGEWYRQMMSMHEQMAALHGLKGQERMAEMNRRLSGTYDEMMRMIPDLDESTDVPFNSQGNPDILNG